ncbi:glycerate kinase type-2 family protein [Alkalilimnicola ehrlichii MLHE-1]|uniref:Glycerate 2-kinase n=1 Tax=Alkalilimnicola ehrlichii (strain ATCC BAA-1101 / DSM 17681 / MLHE-1) TaxID=187272 RepID=Q0A919_ALKEH|nr:glycerate kinase [Alkalilimnicola ehrlichii]ABI56668.1 glycerate 2-kinase [Alkalilimnicola ehrlichii MLHE-1]
MNIQPEAFLRTLFQTAVERVAPERALPGQVPEPPTGRTLVIGAGKGAAAMARALERLWPGPLEGLVVTRYGHAVPCQRVLVEEAGHPVPDERGVQATARILEWVSDLSADDLVIALISGGGSALLVQPAPGLDLATKQAVSRALLRSGADITEINCVRRHLSAVKGGRLAAACHPARVVALLVSDVAGDDPAVIASGPTVGDATTCADARAVLERYRLRVPTAVDEVLRTGRGETPGPEDPRLAGVENRLVATPAQALEAAAERAREAGVTPWLLGDAITGESRVVARDQATLARRIAAGEGPVQPPCVLLSGGETTVTVRGRGRGGPNAEFALAAALALEGHPGIWALAADTDGVDGTEDNAGAWVGPDTLDAARRAGVDPLACLTDNDAYGFFAALGDLLVTGPTLTNVNDFRAILVLPR